MMNFAGFGLEIGVNIFFAPTMQLLLDNYGWRIANRLLAVMCVCVAMPTAMFMLHTPEQVGCLPDGDHGALVAYSALDTGDDDSSTWAVDQADHPGSPTAQAKREQEAEEDDAASFTRKEALRTLPVWLLGIDVFFAAAIGAGTIQVLKLVLRDNNALDVSIPLHVMIPNGVAQAFLPLLAGYLRDNLKVPPKYIVAMSSLLIASAPFTATNIAGEHQIALAMLFGANFGSVWGLKGSVSAVIYADYYG